jgi:hypothetical protein
MLVEFFVFSHANNNDHGGHWGNTTRALTQWQHLMVSCEATDVLHQAMFITLYRLGGMVIDTTIKFVTFFYIVDKNAARKKLFLPHF